MDGLAWCLRTFIQITYRIESMKNTFIRWSVQLVLRCLAFLARRPRLLVLSNAVTRWLARGTVRAKAIGEASSVAELGALWQRSFPSRKQVPIESVSTNTVIARIHTLCPLKGTEDLHACHRMMEFDREVLRHAGGQFVVLQSQATPGVNYCTVAMRRRGQSIADLVPAHEQAACTVACEPSAIS